MKELQMELTHFISGGAREPWELVIGMAFFMGMIGFVGAPLIDARSKHNPAWRLFYGAIGFGGTLLVAAPSAWYFLNKTTAEQLI